MGITLPSYTLSTRSPLCKHVCRAQLTGYPSPSPLHKTTNSKSKHTADTMLRQSAALRAIVRPAVVGKKALNSGLGQKRAAHAISNPTLANIEKRCEGLPPQEQADLWMALRDRMKVNWAELTLQEKKAAYYIAFGAHGPAPKLLPTRDGRYSAMSAQASELHSSCSLVSVASPREAHRL